MNIQSQCEYFMGNIFRWQFANYLLKMAEIISKNKCELQNNYGELDLAKDIKKLQLASQNLLKDNWSKNNLKVDLLQARVLAHQVYIHFHETIEQCILLLNKRDTQKSKIEKYTEINHLKNIDDDIVTQWNSIADDFDNIFLFKISNNPVGHITKFLQSTCNLLNSEEESQLNSDSNYVCEYLNNPNFRVAIFGSFNHGKSTLCNALLGNLVLPNDITLTIGTAISIKYADEIKTCIRMLNGSEVNSNGTELIRRYALLDTNRQMHNNVVSVELFYPYQLLKNGIELLYLPGIDYMEAKDIMVRNQILTADLVIQVLDARKLMTLCEQNSLQDWLIARGIRTIIFVINFLNLLETQEQKKVYQKAISIAENFRFELPNNIPNLYPVDALPALRARLKGDLDTAHSSGIFALESAIQNIFAVQFPELQKIRPSRIIAFIKQVKQALQAQATETELQIEEQQLIIPIVQTQSKAELEKNEAEVCFQRGLTKSQVGDYKAAIEDFTQAINLNPNYAEAYYKRGVAHFYQGELEKTIENYNQALKINPNLSEISHNLDIVRSQLENQHRAVKYYQDTSAYKTQTWKCIHTLTGHSGWYAGVQSVAFSSDGKILASGSDDQTIKLWQPSTAKELDTLRGHTNCVKSVAFSPDGQILASASIGIFKLWNAITGKELRTLKAHTDWIQSIAFSPDGQVLASGSIDKTIKLWEVSTGKEICTLKGHSGSVYAVAFRSDGQILASGSIDKTIRLWEVSTGKEICTLKGHSGSVYTVAFSPDGQILASGSIDKTIRLWEVSTGQELRSLKGHTDLVYTITFSPNGQILASGSIDKTIRLWEVSTGQELHTLIGHKHRVQSVTFSPDGQILASGSDDKTIKLWQVTD